MQAEFNAASASTRWPWPDCPRRDCATMLSLRNPTVFPTFATYSGYSSPTYQNDDEQQTIADLYGGSKANYEAHDPVHLLTGGHGTRVGG